MPLIRKQNAIDVYAAESEPFIVISEEDGHYNEKEGEFSEAHIAINIIHVDAVIKALQKSKEEILAREA